MSNSKKITLSFIFLVFCVLVFSNTANAQFVSQLTSTPVPLTPASSFTSTPEPSFTPTPGSSPNAISTTSPQVQKLSDLELQELDKRLDELETELQDLNNPFSGSWNALSATLTAMLSSGWLIFAVIFLVLFQPQIREILKTLTLRLSSAKFKFGDNEINLFDVDNVVLEREILKTMVFVATIDNDPNPRELELISVRASQMNSKLDVLEDDDKKKILQAAIDIAVVDGDFKNEEYGAIKAKAAQYKISETEMNKMIKITCETKGISLPEILTRRTRRS